MYLGLDLGTSGVRALLVDETGAPVGEASAKCNVSHPNPGWSEQDPTDWTHACSNAMQTLKAAHPNGVAHIKAIGLSGHMHGATLLDQQDKVLRPCMLWNDTRSENQAKEMDAQPEFRALTGNIVFPGFTAPKVAWVRDNEPDIFARLSKVLLPKDYLRLWLTGERISEMSDAAGTAWLDVGERQWSSELLAATGLDLAQVPTLVEGNANTGTLRAELCADWGIAQAPIVAGGGADNAAAACGLGCMSAGDGFLSLGTSGVLFAASDSYAPAPGKAVHSFCHAVPDTWFQMGVTLAATDSLNWLAKLVGQNPADLANQLPNEIEGPSSVTFLPYLSGERTPHNLATPNGVFTGLGMRSDPVAMTAAVMEGVAFSLKDCLNALRATGTTVPSLITTGGGSRSAFWLKTLATVLNLPLHVPAKGEFGAAMGAARLAILAQTKAEVQQVMVKPAIQQVIEPNSHLCERYQSRYAQFQELFPAVQSALGRT